MKRLTTMAVAISALALGSGCQTNKTLTATTSGDVANSGVAATAEVGEASPITQEELQVLRENFLRVHFEFDRATLGGGSRESLTANADILMRHPDVKVRIEGHADQYGSDLYNLALGQRRAESVHSYLANLGVSPAQLEMISYGEERPMTDDGGDKQAGRANRRAEFLVLIGENEVASSY